MRITDASTTWQSVTLAAAEIWTVESGCIRWDTDAAEASRTGTLMMTGESVRFSSGQVVYYIQGNALASNVARQAVA